MTLLSLPTLWVAAGLYITWRVISYLQAERRFRDFATSHGCEPVYQAQDQKWPWGLDRMYKVLTARKRGMDPLDDYFAWPLYEHPTLQRAGLGGAQNIETIEPANVKAILATKFDDWVIGERRHRALRPCQGHNIFTSDGAFWQHSRALLRPQFARDLVNDLQATEKATRTLFEAFGPVDEEGWTGLQDVKPMLLRFVLDTATSFLFGESVESQRALMTSQAGDHDDLDPDTGRLAGSNEFAEAFDESSYYMVTRIRLQQLYFLGNTKHFKKAIAIFKTLPNRIVNQRLQQQQKQQQQQQHEEEEGTPSEPKQKRKFDLLSSLMQHTKDETELRDQTLGVLFASRDTTSSLILWTILLLGQHPEEAESLLDFTSLKSCRYIQHVLNETLRLYQSVPLNSRVAVRDTILPVGGGPDGTKPIAIRKGQQVLWNIYAMQRRKDLWGDDALEFIPERWEDPKRSRMVGDGFAYTPFSAGPRICLGQQYALTEAGYLLVRFVQRYDRIELDPQSAVGVENGRVKKTIGLTLAPMEVRLRVHEAGL
ncbi:cytochrome P450 [Hortaea werneckii]|nr:cytochrome P450 [Hortaea werneckii]KAI7322519.1 cytochrome P450 [Hortaea werneckii]